MAKTHRVSPFDGKPIASSGSCSVGLSLPHGLDEPLAVRLGMMRNTRLTYVTDRVPDCLCVICQTVILSVGGTAEARAPHQCMTSKTVDKLGRVWGQRTAFGQLNMLKTGCIRASLHSDELKLKIIHLHLVETQTYIAFPRLSTTFTVFSSNLEPILTQTATKRSLASQLHAKVVE
jgi:hypothetical protein